MNYKHIIFDFGGVLFDWNPKYLFEKIFDKDEELSYFLNHVCTQAWNEEQDAGRHWKDAEDLLINQYPKFESQIKLYRKRWPEMLRGTISGMEDFVNSLFDDGRFQMFGLTNWSGQTFPYAYYNYAFLRKFKDIVVSGDVKMIKPNAEIFEYALKRFKIEAAESIFIDDNLNNVNAAIQLGIKGIHFKNVQQLKSELDLNS